MSTLISVLIGENGRASSEISEEESVLTSVTDVTPRVLTTLVDATPRVIVTVEAS